MQWTLGNSPDTKAHNRRCYPWHTMEVGDTIVGIAVDPAYARTSLHRYKVSTGKRFSTWSRVGKLFVRRDA